MRRSTRPTPAPEFPDGLQWLNTDRPLSLEKLRGKIVVLHFWTYCCINCLHLLPDLRRLEEKYPEELVVVGVHSAKFSAERDVRNLRGAILRYEIDHPVVNDRQMRVWRDYEVRAWPTTVLIDPFGRIVDRHSGERVFHAYDEQVRKMIIDYDRSGHIDHEPITDRRERDAAVAGLLSFPAKLVADEGSERLFIADTNHNRIVIATLDGEVLDIAGSGASGFEGGGFDVATFHHPRGMALDGTVLYVADTGNHSIRRLDLVARSVVTVAGTGEQAPIFAEGGRGTRDPMASPWDLLMVGDWLYIAMAGANQIWRLRTRSGEFEVYAGGGRKDLVDGKRLQASLAQPSGLTANPLRLYFADSEVSAVRWAHLPPSNFVGTAVGRGLFEYGDRDGGGDDALLQHPLGISFYKGHVYVADSFNHRIKRLNPRTNRIETILGTGEAGVRDGDPAQFHEPGGIACCRDHIYIADTNNHAIRVAHIDGGPVRTLRLHPVSALQPPSAVSCPRHTRELPAQHIAPGDAQLTISIDPGPDYTLDTDAGIALDITTRGALNIESDDEGIHLEPPDVPVVLDATATEGEAEVRVRIRFHYHPPAARACCLEDVKLLIPLQIDDSATRHAIDASYALTDRLSPG